MDSSSLRRKYVLNENWNRKPKVTIGMCTYRCIFKAGNLKIPAQKRKRKCKYLSIYLYVYYYAISSAGKYLRYVICILKSIMHFLTSIYRVYQKTVQIWVKFLPRREEEERGEGLYSAPPQYFCQVGTSAGPVLIHNVTSMIRQEGLWVRKFPVENF